MIINTLELPYCWLLYDDDAMDLCIERWEMGPHNFLTLLWHFWDVGERAVGEEVIMIYDNDNKPTMTSAMSVENLLKTKNTYYYVQLLLTVI